MCDILKFKRMSKPRYRVLRHYKVSMAQKMHDCDWCCVPIFEGDSYEAEVIADNGKIEVRKHHAPECPPDPGGEEAEREADELAEWNSKKEKRIPQSSSQVA